VIAVMIVEAIAPIRVLAIVGIAPAMEVFGAIAKIVARIKIIALVKI